jgi:hypothetical protein
MNVVSKLSDYLQKSNRNKYQKSTSYTVAPPNQTDVGEVLISLDEINQLQTYVDFVRFYKDTNRTQLERENARMFYDLIRELYKRFNNSETKQRVRDCNMSYAEDNRAGN